MRDCTHVTSPNCRDHTVKHTLPSGLSAVGACMAQVIHPAWPKSFTTHDEGRIRHIIMIKAIRKVNMIIIVILILT